MGIEFHSRPNNGETPEEKRLASGFSTLYAKWPIKGLNKPARREFIELIRSGVDKKKISDGADALILNMRKKLLRDIHIPLLVNWLKKRGWEKPAPITYKTTEEIERLEREWEKLKKELNKTPGWAKSLVRRDFKTVKKLSEQAKKHLALNAQYIRAMIDAGAHSDDLWIRFWYSPCFSGLKPEEKTKESFEKFLKEC